MKRFLKDKAASDRMISRLMNFGRSLVTKVSIEDLSTKDAIVAIMGPTGTGKSSFIEMATGIEGIVGHSLESKTNEISVIRVSFPGIADSDICFVDTPGFDHTRQSDVQIFKMISEWLNNTYKRKIQLTGLLYFHRITDNRMAGPTLRTFLLFEKLCGESFNNIVLTTTMWDEVESEEGTLRKKELEDDYWRAMIERGSSVKRFLYTRESAFEVLGPIFEEVNSRNALLLQKEMEELKMQIKETSAGKTLYLELEELVGRQQTILGKIGRELHGESKLGPDELRLLMEEYGKASAQLQRATEDLQKMKITVGERIQKFTRGIDWLRMFSIFSAMKKRKILTRPDPESNKSLHGGFRSSQQRQDDLQLSNLVENDAQIMVDKEGANERGRAEEKLLICTGPPGSGKSQFIDSLTQQTQWAGGSLTQQNHGVRSFHLKNSNLASTVILLDTPGFDDRFKPIFEEVKGWLQSERKQNQVAAVLYFHNIMDNRSVVRPPFQYLKKLCGDDPKKVFFVSTHWDRQATVPGKWNHNETELRNEQWKPFLDSGAQATRFDKTTKTAREIAQTILSSSLT